MKNRRQTMIQVVFKRYKLEENKFASDNGYEDTAYFPTWKFAFLAIARWNLGSVWFYRVISAKEVGYDESFLHADSWHYTHFW